MERSAADDQCGSDASGRVDTCAGERDADQVDEDERDPMARPASASRGTFEVANRMTMTKTKVRMASTANALPTASRILDALPYPSSASREMSHCSAISSAPSPWLTRLLLGVAVHHPGTERVSSM